MVQRQESDLRQRVHHGVDQRHDAGHATHGGHQALGRTVHQRQRPARLPQGHRHRRDDEPALFQGRIAVGPTGQSGRFGIYGHRRAERRRRAQQFVVFHPAHDGPAALQTEQSRGQQHHADGQWHENDRRPRSLRKTAAQSAGCRAQIRPRGRKRHLDRQHDGTLQSLSDDLLGHQPLRMDHRPRHVVGRRRRRQQHHVGDGLGAHGRVPNPRRSSG